MPVRQSGRRGYESTRFSAGTPATFHEGWGGGGGAADGLPGVSLIWFTSLLGEHASFFMDFLLPNRGFKTDTESSKSPTPPSMNKITHRCLLPNCGDVLERLLVVLFGFLSLLCTHQHLKQWRTAHFVLLFKWNTSGLITFRLLRLFLCFLFGFSLGLQLLLLLFHTQELPFFTNLWMSDSTAVSVYTLPWCKPDMHDCITSNIFEDGSNLAFWFTCMSSEGKYCNQNQTKALRTAIKWKSDFKKLWLVNFYHLPFWKGSQRSPQCAGLSSEPQTGTRL